VRRRLAARHRPPWAALRPLGQETATVPTRETAHRQIIGTPVRIPRTMKQCERGERSTFWCRSVSARTASSDRARHFSPQRYGHSGMRHNQASKRAEGNPGRRDRRQRAAIFGSLSVQAASPCAGQRDESTTRRFGGTGLGPTDFVDAGESDGRRIWVESEPGHGSTFQFTATFPSRSSPPADPSQPVLINLPVLIVDDNPVNRRIFHEVLTRWQMKPSAVASGRSRARRAHRSVKDPAIRFPLVLLDAEHARHDGLAVADR